MGDSLRPARSLLLSAIVALSATFLTFLPREGSAYTPHLPILIAGDTNFTAVNGVTGGSGTLADPYLIEGWEINTTTTHGIEVSTRAARINQRAAAKCPLPPSASTIMATTRIGMSESSTRSARSGATKARQESPSEET